VPPAVAEAISAALPVAYMPQIPDRPENAEAVVYRLYSEPGDLLYVGCTVDPWARFKAHGRRQPWWDEVTSSEVIWYDSMQVAAGVEQQAIFTEHPVYNLATARYGYATTVANRADEPAADPVPAVVEPEPVQAGPWADQESGSAPVQPGPEPVVEPVPVRPVQPRPTARRKTPRRGSSKPVDPRVGQRFNCPCCDEMVSRMTLDRHAERAAQNAADLAARAGSNGHSEPVSVR
jgi:predicted GIY-YIG superfamily endonuclease